MSVLKISFLGDIMCEGPFLRAAGYSDNNGEQFDFSKAFIGNNALLSESDYIIGNLETPLNREHRNLTRTKDIYSFNTPIEFAEALKELGVNLVLTANNHCNDRGTQGIIETIDILDSLGIGHTGTFKANSDKKPYYFELSDGTTVAVISCTDSTNCDITKNIPNEDNVNLLSKQTIRLEQESFITRIKRAIIKIIGLRTYKRVRKIIRHEATSPYVDNNLDYELVAPYLKELEKQVTEARKKADLIFICPHMGGQFNELPGAYSEYVMEKLSTMGVSAVVGSHPHVIQKFERLNECPCFFSIGNFSMSMCTDYINLSNLPEYGLIVHFYVRQGKFEKITGSFVKMIDVKGFVNVVPVYDLYKKATNKERDKIKRDVDILLRRILNAKDDADTYTDTDIKEEYVFV